MSRDAETTARDLLETVPLLMRFIRDQVRRGRAAGLTLPQYRTLNFVRRTRQPSLSAAAGHLGLSLPAMSRLAGGLVERGLLERRPVATNRRQIALGLSARGEATLEAGRAVIRRELAGALEALSAAEHAAVRRALPPLQRTFGPRVPAAGRKGGQAS